MQLLLLWPEDTLYFCLSVKRFDLDFLLRFGIFDYCPNRLCTDNQALRSRSGRQPRFTMPCTTYGSMHMDQQTYIYLWLPSTMAWRVQMHSNPLAWLKRNPGGVTFPKSCHSCQCCWPSAKYCRMMQHLVSKATRSPIQSVPCHRPLLSEVTRVAYARRFALKGLHNIQAIDLWIVTSGVALGGYFS